jgi:Fic family protein
MDTDVIEFLQQSNYIEGVNDSISLDQAVLAWKYIISKKRLTKQYILDTHNILMLHQNIDKKDKGQLRRCDVQVAGNIKLSWSSVPFALDMWIERIYFIKDVKYEKKDLEQMNKSLHIQYEDIHPFIDGNGRTGRIFMNWWRLSRGLPILIIREENKFEYYKWFKK